MKLSSLLLLAAIFNLGCSQFATPPPGLADPGTVGSASENSASKVIISDTGTVRFIDLEGGFYGIVGDETGNFNPTNLGEEFRKDGLRVKFTARHLTDRISSRMWGSMIEIVSIEAIGFEPEKANNLKEKIRNFKLE